MTLVERYCQGEQGTVCEELESLGEAARIQSSYEDAVSVAREFVERCIRNLTKIEGRLQELEYVFDRDERSLLIRDDWDYSSVESFESDFGALPIILRAVEKGTGN